MSAFRLIAISVFAFGCSTADNRPAAAPIAPGGTAVANTCNPGEYGCRGTNACIQRSQICDTRSDCPQGDDETGCTSQPQNPANPGGTTCARTTFDCGNNVCVPIANVCDGAPQCQNGADELGCPAQTGQQCGGNTPNACVVTPGQPATCVAQNQVCPQNSDRPGRCGQPQSNQFCCNNGRTLCSDGRCYDNANVCGGQCYRTPATCQGGGQNQNCNQQGLLSCGANDPGCYSPALECDGVAACTVSNADELGCPAF